MAGWNLVGSLKIVLPSDGLKEVKLKGELEFIQPPFVATQNDDTLWAFEPRSRRSPAGPIFAGAANVNHLEWN